MYTLLWQHTDSLQIYIEITTSKYDFDYLLIQQNRPTVQVDYEQNKSKAEE